MALFEYYWNELEFVWQALLITVLSFAILIWWAITLNSCSDFYRDEKKTKTRTISIQIFILSSITIALMIVSDALVKDTDHRNAKVKSILDNYWNERESYPMFWSTLQSTYECCGVNGSCDWGQCVPLSCYQSETTSWSIFKRTVTCLSPHENGCYSVVVKYLDKMTCWYKFLGLVFVSLGVFGIVGMLLSLLLHSILRQRNNDRNSMTKV